MLARIAALLRQAEGTDNTHEADAFMAAAQRLATATSIDLAVARSHSSNRTKAQMPEQRTITIGNAGARGLRTYVQLFTVIAMANDVKCDVASNSTFVYAYGFGEDIDASHALYASLVMQMVRASEAYIASGAHRPTPTITARINFQLAFGARIGKRLSEARDDAQREATRALAPQAGHRYRAAEQGHRAQGLLPADLGGPGDLAGDQRNGGVLVGGAASGRSRGPQGPAGWQRGAGWKAFGAGEVSVRDTQRAKVYAAEEFVRTLFDRADEHGNRVVEFFGTQLTLPPEGRFAIDGVRAALRRRRARHGGGRRTMARHPSRWPCAPGAGSPRRITSVTRTARASPCRRGAPPGRCANWSCCTRSPTTSAPPSRPTGASSWPPSANSPALVMGPEVAHVLRVVYAKEGVR